MCFCPHPQSSDGFLASHLISGKPSDFLDNRVLDLNIKHKNPKGNKTVIPALCNVIDYAFLRYRAIIWSIGNPSRSYPIP
jgi:hypothetical protein